MEAELIQFIGALIVFAGILVGSYWFVYAPTRNNSNRERQQNRFGD
ncbi:MAG: hypothetical protein ACFB50_06765 [Rubrobacteraceae bacterium]